jgi:hypothetical protein
VVHLPSDGLRMSGPTNDSVLGKGLDRADPTAPEAPVAKRHYAFRRRWSVAFSAAVMVLLLLAVVVLLYRTNQRFFMPSKPAGF